MIKRWLSKYGPTRKQGIFLAIAAVLIIGTSQDPDSGSLALILGLLLLLLIYRLSNIRLRGWKGREGAPSASQQQQPQGGYYQQQPPTGGYYRQQQPPQQDSMTVTIPAYIDPGLEWHREEIAPGGYVLQICVRVKPADEKSHAEEEQHAYMGGYWR